MEMKAKKPMSSNKIAVINTTGRKPLYWKSSNLICWRIRQCWITAARRPKIPREITFDQNIPEFGDAKPESNQREGGANAHHEGSVSSRKRLSGIWEH